MNCHIDSLYIIVDDLEREFNLRYVDAKHSQVFEELAKERSLCPSKIVGGSLGWINKNNKMDKEFTKAAFSMQKGNISEPVQSAYGWHIIRLDDVKK